VGSEYLRSFSEHNALGVPASVYNVNAKTWVAPSESVDDIEQGRKNSGVCRGAPQANGHPRTTFIGVEELPFSVGQ
jgi:hypothetical protein